MEKAPSSAAAAPTDSPVRQRILGAAFSCFVDKGYAGTSTLEIATRAKVSKRDLYAHFADKQAMLVACIAGRAERMGLSADLPTPTDRTMLAAMLKAFGTRIVREVSHPTVVALFRLAVAEAERSPEVGRALGESGRAATRTALADLFTRARSAGLIGRGEPVAMANQYLGLLWEGLMVDLLLGIHSQPTSEEIERRAASAAAAFLALHPPAA
jgi:AcrR family transcriptional regulator